MPKKQALIESAQAAASQAYSPYSGVPKGAAVACEDGTIYSGCSVEFATFGGSLCAEVAALASAIAAGKRKFTAMAVVPRRLPCGSCRQFMREFGLHWDVYYGDDAASIQETTLERLLPLSFGPSNLNDDHFS